MYNQHLIMLTQKYYLPKVKLIFSRFKFDLCLIKFRLIQLKFKKRSKAVTLTSFYKIYYIIIIIKRGKRLSPKQLNHSDSLLYNPVFTAPHDLY